MIKKISITQKISKYSRFLLIFGSVCLGLSFIFMIYDRNTSRFIGQVPEIQVKENNPVSLSIPSLKLNLELEQGFILEGKWIVSDQKANYLFTAGRPGTPTNTVVYAHNKWKIFGQLYKLKKGDKLIITIEDGQMFNYEVIEKVTVKPNQLDYVMDHGQEELTLYTCTGLLDSKRLVIQAVPTYEF